MVLYCQVVLSRGGYTSAIDLWSLGCIFGELLQRVAGLGAASTPQLQVAPMFAIQGKPRTPSEGYALAACFDFMGANSSKTVDALIRDHANQILPLMSSLSGMFLRTNLHCLHWQASEFICFEGISSGGHKTTKHDKHGPQLIAITHTAMHSALELECRKLHRRIVSCLSARREVFGAQAGPGNSTTQTELQALFDIIGTPHWTDVEALQSPAWRKYLQRLPGKAPTLYRCPHAFCCKDCYCVHAFVSSYLSVSSAHLVICLSICVTF